MMKHKTIVSIETDSLMLFLQFGGSKSQIFSVYRK